ncbi:unnamed protein product [Protopolystoma xenopodis]|uniref:Uncharacterized protein n=1 Tax=Protopolystoma xenopodis TaxID=117903 RepID=A0A3S5B6C5_9PLAT|nr:unnamed protein product [Protopolystoma xenopodis]
MAVVDAIACGHVADRPDLVLPKQTRMLTPTELTTRLSFRAVARAKHVILGSTTGSYLARGLSLPIAVGGLSTFSQSAASRASIGPVSWLQSEPLRLVFTETLGPLSSDTPS